MFLYSFLVVSVPCYVRFIRSAVSILFSAYLELIRRDKGIKRIGQGGKGIEEYLIEKMWYVEEVERESNSVMEENDGAAKGGRISEKWLKI